MTAINVVRFSVKPGMEQAFLDAHRNCKAAWPGLVRGIIAEVGTRRYVLVGEWPDIDALANARKSMIATLETFRHTLNDLGPGFGVTDAVSGQVVRALE
jgi:hypothetical protein